MKITLIEFEGCFGIDLEAENMEEASKLVRFGMNRTKVTTCGSDVYEGGKFTASLVFGKNRRGFCSVPKRK